MGRFLSFVCIASFVAWTHGEAQDAGANRLHALVNGLTVTPRVLVIGARPTDANENLIAWLARGHHVQTAFLSLTRGESSPNYTGLETGATLGAIHVQEILTARAVDGGEQYFTRAFDFGAARNAADVFRQWDHSALLGDVVSVVRSFRPHVIIAIARVDTASRDGQQQVSAIVAREVFDAALDTTRFTERDFGIAWRPAALYEPGAGVSIDSHDFDTILGHTYAEIANTSRAQLRSFGFESPPWRDGRSVQWHRIAEHLTDSTIAPRSTSLFDGIDTTFARLEQNLPVEFNRGETRTMVTQLPALRAYADSARTRLDVTTPSTIIPYLQRVAELASSARNSVHGCKHPSRDAAISVTNWKCESRYLDLDASLDLVQRRAYDALLAAAGVSVEALADREFLASGDTASVTVTVSNNGDRPLRVNDIAITGAVPVRMAQPISVAPHTSASVHRLFTTAAYAHPWWLYKRDQNFYPPSISARDGVPHPGLFSKEFAIFSIAIPENIRRIADVTATLTIGATTTIAESVGPVLFRIADPALGVQDRMTSGVPAVGLVFERAVEWAQAHKPLKKQIHVNVKSYSDKPQTFRFDGSKSGTVRLDSFPPSIILAPHESRDVSIAVRGTPDTAAYDLALKGVQGPTEFTAGFRTAQYSYLTPMHFFRDANVRLLGVELEIPARLSVAYIRGAGDDADVALKQLGIPTYVFNAEGLVRFDLDAITTIVIGPDAFRSDRNLVAQMPRLLEFVHKGGTIVMMNNSEVLEQGAVLPFPVAFAKPYSERVLQSDAQVSVLDRRAKLLTWPNVIRDGDWRNWVGARALNVPTVADPRYAVVVELHDPDERANRNALLMAPVGKGRIIYSSLTLTQQISNAVPGAMRLFVNLLSQGLGP